MLTSMTGGSEVIPVLLEYRRLRYEPMGLDTIVDIEEAQLPLRRTCKVYSMGRFGKVLVAGWATGGLTRLLRISPRRPLLGPK